MSEDNQGVGFFPSSCRFWRLYSSHWAKQKFPLPAEPSNWPHAAILIQLSKTVRGAFLLSSSSTLICAIFAIACHTDKGMRLS